jgi:hypothetical protein
MFNGNGNFLHPDGDTYEGEWLNNKNHGKGTYVHMNGSKYVGQWKNDL